MNDALARERLSEVLAVIDRWGELYERRWGYGDHDENPALVAPVAAGIDEVRARTRLARDVIAAMGEDDLVAKVVEHEEGAYGGHPYTQARVAIVEAIAILTQQEELAEIVGPAGPQLSASELHPIVWGDTARTPNRGYEPATNRVVAEQHLTASSYGSVSWGSTLADPTGPRWARRL